MTTKSNFYTSKTECITSDKIKNQTNERYSQFKQNIYTAGDEEQFQSGRDRFMNEDDESKDISTDNIFRECEWKYYHKYEKLYADSVTDTFRYIFHKFKKGIYIRIVGNKLNTFLPFSKVNYVNDFSHKIKFEKDIDSFFKYISETEGYRYNSNRVNKFLNTWYANNSLLRYEYPVNETDTNVGLIQDMFEELCAKRNVPDIEIFINKRDYPILTVDETEPYNHIWDSVDEPLHSYKFDKYIPILSFSTAVKYADVPIPTNDDWSRVQSYEGKFFPKNQCDFDREFLTKWEDKKPIAIFRGSSTGSGVTIETNNRLKIAYMSMIIAPKDDDGSQLIDAGITKWKLRPRKIQGEKFLKTIEISKIPFDLVNKMSCEEQSKYKYIINIDGHVKAYRLSVEMNMGSVILMVESEYELWYSKLLKPYVHYVPVKKDLSDILEQIKWCKKNDEKCKEISLNAKKFYDKYLGKNGMMDYLQKILFDLKNVCGKYNYYKISPLELQLQYESKHIWDKSFPTTSKCLNDINKVPSVDRFYSLLEGIKFLVNFVNTKGCFDDVAKKIGVISKNKHGHISEYALADFKFIVKTTGDLKKKREHIHEAFICLTEINLLSKFMPNFAYIFGVYNKGETINIVSEKIEGETLYDYIVGENFKIGDYLDIIIQLIFVFEEAQYRCGFVHYDVTPWNIIIQPHDELKTVCYSVDEKTYKVNSKVLPVLIDYGKSHVIHDYVHYGFVDMFGMNRLQDVIMLVFTSIYCIITKRNISKKESSILIRIMNFFGNFTAIKEVKTFLYNNHRYSELISFDFGSIEYKRPIHLFEYIVKNKLRENTYEISDYFNCMNIGSSGQVFEYTLANTDIEKRKSFTNTLNMILNTKLPTHSNKMFLVYIQYEITYMCKTLFSQLKSYSNNNEDYILYKKTLNYIDEYYKNILVDCEDDVKKCEILPELMRYNEETCLNPDKVKKLLDLYGDESVDDYVFLVDYIYVFKFMKRVNKNMCNSNKEYVDNFNENYLKEYLVNFLTLKNNLFFSLNY